MGRINDRGDAFGRWYDRLSKGKRRAFWLAPVATVVLGTAFIGVMNQIMFTPKVDRVVVWCDPMGREIVDGKETPKVTISPDDPRLDRDDLDASMDRICNPTI